MLPCDLGIVCFFSYFTSQVPWMSPSWMGWLWPAPPKEAPHPKPPTPSLSHDLLKFLFILLIYFVFNSSQTALTTTTHEKSSPWGQKFGGACSWLLAWCPEPCLAHSTCLINICGVNNCVLDTHPYPWGPMERQVTEKVAIGPWMGSKHLRGGQVPMTLDAISYVSISKEADNKWFPGRCINVLWENWW